MRERDVDADDVVEQRRCMSMFGSFLLVIRDRLPVLQDLFCGRDDRNEIGEGSPEGVGIGDLEENVGLCLLGQARPSSGVSTQ